MFLIFFLTVGTFLVVLLLTGLTTFLTDKSASMFSREEASSYECGFEQHSLSRVPVSIRYFMLTIVFLIFDLEIMFLVFSPLDFMVFVDTYFMKLSAFSFLFIMFLGFFYEWYDGSLDWVM